ncbi:MAG TPA: histidine kinase [Saprospiraceae bacterium]|nr:histidine kinase [Saprospiraceae bacterium]
MSKAGRSTLLYVLYLSITTINAQTYKSITPQHELYHVDLNASENFGLMTNMIQDNDGYLWISSSRGLLVFDGNKTVTYSPDDPKYPMGSSIEKSRGYHYLRKDNEGKIYVSISPHADILSIDPLDRIPLHQYSLAKKDTETFYFLDVSDNEEILFISREQNSESFSIVKVNLQGEKQTIYKIDKKVHGDIRSYYYFQNLHWLQTNTGILRISSDGKESNFYPFDEPFLPRWTVIHDDQNFFFCDERKRSVMCWNYKSKSPRVFAPIPAPLLMICNYMYIDQHLLYIAGGTNFCIIDTLSRTYEDISAQFYDLKSNKLPGSLSEDMAGFSKVEGQIYYLGHRNLYALRDVPPAVSFFKDSFPAEAAHVSMRGLTEDEDHNVYASYYSNLAVKSVHDDRFQSFDLLKKVNTNLYSAFDLTYHDHHLFWHSLSIDLNSGRIQQIIPNVTNGHVAQMLSGDTLWLYTWYTDHLYTYDLSSGITDSIPIDLAVTNSGHNPLVVNAMLQSEDPSAIWLATRTYGIVLLGKNGKVKRTFSHEVLGISQEEGICDLFLHGEVMWFGCLDGLGRLNTRTGDHSIFKDPVMNVNGNQNTRTVFSILPDEKNGFYLGTSSGLVYFDTITKEYFHLDPAHPMAQNEYNRTSSFRDSQGRYYFGTTNGLYSFKPEELDFKPASDTLRPIRLYNISIFNGSEKQYRYLSSELNDLKKLELQPSETNIEFSFSVADFEKNIYYSYHVVGMNEKWSDYSPEDHVLLYSLPPGDYTLEIKASSNADDEKASFYSLDIHMPGYWYQKAWVIALFILLTSGLIVAVIRYRFQQKFKRQKELEKLRVNISSDLHDDVGTILSGLAMQSQMMSYEALEEQRKPLLELSDMSREAMDRMRDTVWAIDARKDKFENLIDRMRDFAEKNLERKNITHAFIVNGIDGKKFISPETRQNIYLIFKEAITNIVKHSDATHVMIKFVQDGTHLHLIIHDNGKEKPIAKTDGLGVSNMMMRAKKIGGELNAGYDDGFKVELII